MSQSLPALNSFGKFVVIQPFTITDVNYRCAALQLISALVTNGISVFTTYYSPAGISNAQYLTDLANNAAIVTLESVDGPTLYIPSSFIDTMPVELAVPYSRMVISLELGELPDSLVLTQLLNDMQTIANNYVGVVSKPVLHKIQSVNIYSYPEHLLHEAQRNLAVQRYVSFYTGKTNADSLLSLARKKITLLEAALIATNKLLQL